MHDESGLLFIFIGRKFYFNLLILVLNKKLPVAAVTASQLPADPEPEPAAEGEAVEGEEVVEGEQAETEVTETEATEEVNY